MRLHYPTRTGALLRIDGRTAGAFDARHGAIDVTARAGEHELALEVERHAVPTWGLPSSGGIHWRWIAAHSHATPRTSLGIEPSPAAYGEAAGACPARRRTTEASEVALIAHAHLDVAWLWTYAEARRKARRTFATALRQLELEPRFVYAQSQPQLYAWVKSDDPELFARIRSHVTDGWDASVASMWVEPDLHALSGESILRQFALGVRWIEAELGVSPSIVWLPDTFGFPSTLPQLAVHAGMRGFATTKLQWNDTTRWPHPQFRWLGDDGSELLAAVIDRYDGRASKARAAVARSRAEPLIHGYGDGGGGAADADLSAYAAARAPWTTFPRWFDAVAQRALPEHRGELYLETHRGTYTTHRDVKSRNAALERELDAAEELVAWCVAVRTPPSATRPLVDDLHTARTLLARNQFHDVLAGTSISAAYDDVRREHERVATIAGRVVAGASAILPRADVGAPTPVACTPEARGDAYAFANDLVRALVRADGTIVELAGVDGYNRVALANGLALFVDRPRAWDAWNLDAGYERRRRALRPQRTRAEDDALLVELAGDGVAATMRVALFAGEPYLRVELAVRWGTPHRILRAEHRFAIRTEVARFGQPHGTLERRIVPASAADRARFEVPAQRFVHVSDGERGVAILAPDSYGWNALALRDGGVRLGTSLLRAPTWPDPGADRGEHQIAYALAPTAGATIGALEAAWREYAEIDRVRLFTCDDPAVLVVATKPADDGRGVVVRVRECDGASRMVTLRCGARARQVEPVDACERAQPGEVSLDGESLRFVLPAFALRSFRVSL